MCLSRVRRLRWRRRRRLRPLLRLVRPVVAREAGVVGAVPEWVREVACEAPELVLKVLPLGVAAVAVVVGEWLVVEQG